MTTTKTPDKNSAFARAYPSELMFQIFSLLVAFILVHTLYVVLVRPQADHDLSQQQAAVKADPDYEPKASFYIILKDYEQEACFVLMAWALAILGYKGRDTYRQKALLESDLIDLPEGMPIALEDTGSILDHLGALAADEQDYLPPRALITAVERFGATRSVQDVSSAARQVCDTEGDRLESELSTIRYIAWAIPSIGFIGTVRGIGDALGQAHRAVQGDITGVTESLGVAFNSTFIALVISIVLMFFIHQLQHAQERLVLDTDRYIDRWFVRRLRN